MLPGPRVGCACTVGAVIVRPSGIVRFMRAYLDAVNGSLFLIDDDGVNVPPKHSRDRDLVLSLRRLAKIHDTSTHTYKRTE